MPHISGFHRLTPRARLDALASTHAELAQLVPETFPTRLTALDRMSENVVGAFELPLSVVTGFIIDQVARDFVMVTEEPSVVAAANAATALFSRSGGTTTRVSRPVTRAQIVLTAHDALAACSALAHLEPQKDALIDHANACDPALVAAGGGAFALSFEIQNQASCDTSFVVTNLDVHTVDAMGANAVNTMAETVMHEIERQFVALNLDAHPTPLMAILTNAAPGRRVEAKITLPFAQLNGFKTNCDGQTLAARIELASRFAEVNAERAATHNKGILNGLCAAATALGQDTRALSVAAIDAACASGQHKPLATWRVVDETLVGQIQMPIVAGLVGGARHAMPAIDAAFEFAQIKTYDQLVALLASLGLAQNFAALAALVTEGIQAGHMKLHLRKQLDVTTDP